MLEKTLPSLAKMKTQFIYETVPIKKNEGDVPHIHDSCEIYLNVSGNVSFMVEDKLYPLSCGDMIITKPNEYHHSVFNADGNHTYYVLWLPASATLCGCIMQKKLGQQNLVCLPGESKKRILAQFASLNRLLNADGRELAVYAALFGIMAAIDQHYREGVFTPYETPLPAQMEEMLTYINRHFAEIKSLGEVANRFHVSQNHMARLFRRHLGITPHAYLTAKRISESKRLLLSGATVTESCFDAGFCDYSHFIATFKKFVGQTPHKYKNAN